ncbi:DUF5134 domain-containing protein [Streptomyces sp. P38-E01]|uniref:DUF5134 domain-containing protein n=1 Tax=Streptomyces tardus TaxID=2780544 RepID=A0A949JK37_9ACTN|nr:DUF5134 domain-containing protein [Streptomyces tardus]MBU7600209.1 DUF5134 domain-containing protein [Streptomyces tardus]
MHGPPLVGWLLVLVCATAGAVCLARSRRRTGGPERRSAWLETAMGFSMALMAVPGSPVPAPVFAVVFVGIGLVAALLWARNGPGPGRRHLPHHLIEAGAMAAMALGALGSGGGPGGHAAHSGGGAHGGGVGLPAALLACYFLVCALRRAASLATVPSPAAAQAVVAPANAVPAAASPVVAGPYAVAATPTATPAPVPGLAALPETAHACRAALALATAMMLLL